MCIVFKVEEIRCEGGRDMLEVFMIYWLGELIPCANRINHSNQCSTTSTIQLIEYAVDIIELELYLVLVLLGDIVPFG